MLMQLQLFGLIFVPAENMFMESMYFKDCMWSQFKSTQKTLQIILPI